MTITTDRVRIARAVETVVVSLLTPKGKAAAQSTVFRMRLLRIVESVIVLVQETNNRDASG